MYERIVQTNLGTIVELTHSNDGHFEQLFITHAIFIQGFAIGCQLIIAIDSSHMSGTYGGALFSATTYDANDYIFPLAFGITSLENYEDWFWFLVNLKTIIGENEVVIISNRHLALLRSVLEIFGADNHAYCYRYLKGNFNTFISRHNTRGNKGKKTVLQWLDSIAYVHKNDDYDSDLFELRTYNEALAKWVEENSPEH